MVAMAHQKEFIPSEQQQAIFDYVESKRKQPGRKALAVKARAGTGKTTTAEQLIKRVPGIRGVYVAFNADIVTEVEPRLAGTGVVAKTFHGLALGSLLKHIQRAYKIEIPKDFVDGSKYRTLIADHTGAISGIDTLFENAAMQWEDVSPADIQKEFLKSAHLLAHYLRVKLVEWNDLSALQDIIFDYGLDDPYLTDELLTIMVRIMPTIMEQGEQIVKTSAIMDFDDMIYWAVRWDVKVWINDWVIVDEAQDLSPMQRAIVAKVLNPNKGFIIIIGDDKQAIYRFTGADSDSFDLTVDHFKAEILPLTVTRRCGKIIVHHAQSIVPDFVAHESKHRGKIVWLGEGEFINHVKVGDMVISRVKAPLIAKAIECIAAEIPATILGGNIGKALIDLMEKISKHDDFTWADAKSHVDDYEYEMAQHWLGKEDELRAEEVRDDCDGLRVLLKNANPYCLEDFADYVNSFFTDANRANVVTFCTGHKSKGLEANRVFILKPEKLPLVSMNMHPESQIQEDNLDYVVRSRAIETLVYLTNEKFLDKNPNMPSYVQTTFDDLEWDENDITQLKVYGGWISKQDAFEIAVLNANGALGDETEITVAAEVANDALEPPTVEVTGSPIDEWAAPEIDAKRGYDPDDAQVELKLLEAEQPVSPDPVHWAQWLLNRNDVVILDTETTDRLDKKNPLKKIEIVSIAVIDLAGNTLLNTLIKPVHATINPEAAAIHGITMEHLEAEGATDFAANWDAIKAVIQDKHVVIFNRDFDKVVLGGCVHLFGLTMPHVKGWHCAMLRYIAHNPNKATKYKPSGGWWKLTEALEQEGITPDENAHDALADVLMTRQLIQAMATNEGDKWLTKPANTSVVKNVVETPVVEEVPAADEPVTESVAVEETPVIEDKHIAALNVVKVDEPNEPVKVADPYTKLMAKLGVLTLPQAEAFRDILDDYIQELRAQETEAVTQ
jgi:DNA helicase-2/ATP-dependent DNA helicase PcrA